MNKINLLIVGGIFFILTISCSSMMKGKELAEPAVENFHAQFNAEKYSDIYKAADEEFKKSVTEKEFIELLAAINRKLGTVNKSDSAGWRVNTTTAGTFASVSYNIEFRDGKGTESFVFRITDDKALLYNYNVNSPLLITK
jgi:hypothetical protein